MEKKDINYNREAFFLPWNLVFLIITMLTAIMVSDSSLFNVMIMMAAAVELMYLGIVPKNKRFRRLIRSQKMAERAKPPSEKETFMQLNDHHQRRYVRLRKIEKAIEANYRRLSYASQGMLEGHLKKLDDLLDSMLNMLQMRERYEMFANNNMQDEVLGKMAELREKNKTASPKVQAINKRRMKVLERRNDRFKKAYENLDVIDAQIATIEDVTQYINEQSLTMRNPEEITFQLDTLLSEVEETQTSIVEIEDVFASQADLLNDIDAFDSESDSLLTDPNRERSKH